MRRGRVWLAIAGCVVATRLTHSGIVWVEEAYPAAAAIQILHGKLPYRDFFFDKPPLSALVYLVWGARDGWIQRLAGAAFVMLCAWLAWRLAGELWGERESVMAAALMAFHLTFWTPSAVMALAPDLLMVAPHLACVWCAARRRHGQAGVMAGIALLVNPKGVFVIAASLAWARGRAAVGSQLAGFAMITAASAGVMAGLGMWPGYWEQVWVWGSRYSSDSFLDHPLREGLVRTAAWAGFHGALVVGAVLCWRQERKLAWWALVSIAAVCVGLRFFPRYYFQLLPVMTLAAARGLALHPRAALASAVLLGAPLIRFGPQYWSLAAHGDSGWADTALNRDSREAARLVNTQARATDTILVWGYRPDLLVYTRLALGTPYLDSQPLTGVLADRHLARAKPTVPELARGNRERIAAHAPVWIADGLGPLNPALAMDQFAEMKEFLANYTEVGRTSASIIYRRR